MRKSLPILDRSRTLQGGLLIVSAVSVLGLIDNLIPLIAAEASLWQFHAVRSLMGIPFITLLVLARGRSLIPLRPVMLLIRSILLAAAILLYFGALALIPVAEAGAGLFSAPIFVLLLSAIFFGVRIGIWRITAVLTGFIGVLLVLRPDVTDLQLAAVLPMLAAIFYGAGQLITRHHCANEDTFLVLLGFYIALGVVGLIGTVILTLWPAPTDLQEAIPFFTRGWRPITGSFLLWTAVQSFGSLIAVAGLIRGYQIADPTYLGVFEYSFLLFAGIWGWIFWRHVPDMLAVIGMATIVLSGVVIILRSRTAQST
ncbi:MAG: DMT family transporter [Rhodobacteraceae bacterium]|nr:DMT family transporter [Paracoccaceae bacterium]MCY4196381.1 DMT family transporter [Paracoccaceae bacterium]MCY4326467.1 DMT family transporter [Paracoccaceae bacterium]